MSVGGQGAPLTALVDYLQFHHPDESRLLIHLGGLARVVYVPANGRIQDLFGYEAGPCNMLLDSMMRRMTGGRESCDSGGKHAVQGRCLEPLLERWLALPYLQRRPPKSLPRQGFGDDFAQQAVELARQNGWTLHDLLCTATHFVARGITDSLKRFLPHRSGRVFLSGGGVRNGLLWHLLQQQLGEMHKLDALGVPSDVRKPLAFGVLAALTLDGVPANVPAATGAAGARVLGNITPGSTSNWARCLGWMARQTALPEVEDGD
jgi:anhydro-N-acetylmuramic acid kinase